MRPKTLKHTILLSTALLVVISGTIISQIVTHQYSKNLLAGATVRAEGTAHKLALDAADKVLINDLVALQKLLDDQMVTDSNLAYLFIVKSGEVLTHTFDSGMPLQLIDANHPLNNQTGALQKLVSQHGEYFLDVAWPIFDGKAGVLRLGLSEEPLRKKVRHLWVQMTLITFGILIMALLFSGLFIHRITRPLLQLTAAAQKIDEGSLDRRVEIMGRDEVTKLTAAFNAMLKRLKVYTQRLEASNRELEQKNVALDRAHRQLHTSFEISSDIAALANLKDVGVYLIHSFRGIVQCRHMALVIFSNDAKTLFLLTPGRFEPTTTMAYQQALDALKDISEVTFCENSTFDLLPLPAEISSTERLAVFPLKHHGSPIGAMLIGCQKSCRCVPNEMDVLEMILQQTTGALRRALQQEEEIRLLRARIEPNAQFAGLVGKDPQMQTVYKLIEDVSPTEATVLIQGESGTGKELVARAIHQLSPRHAKPFVVINCSAYPSTLLESELFGHEKGAFTGATRRKIGRFEQGNGGTIFLDEIGEIPLAAQIKLLRVLQSHKFERLGGERTLTVDVRVLAATNKNLIDEVTRGHFREDLFYRLNVIPIQMPPLRLRQNDIPLLCQHFLKTFAQKQGKAVDRITPEAMRKLLKYHWPGNVRELENSIEHALVLSRGQALEVTDLPETVLEESDKTLMHANSPKTLSESEAEMLLQTLEDVNWNKTAAAERLGISRSTLYEKLKKYHIRRPTLH